MQNGTKNASKDLTIARKQLNKAVVNPDQIIGVANKITGSDNAYNLSFATSTDTAKEQEIIDAFVAMISGASTDLVKPNFSSSFDKNFDGARFEPMF